MKNLITILMFFTLSFFTCDLYAQSDEDSTETACDKSGDNVLSVEGLFSKLGIKLKKDKAASDIEYRNKPVIEFNYAYPQLRSDKINQTLKNVGSLELGLGYESLYNSYYTERIKEMETSQLKLTFLRDNLSHKKDNDINKGKPEMWRITWGKSSGHGIDMFSGNLFMPYYSYGVTWSNIKFDNVSYTGNRLDSSYMKRFDNVIKFGTTTEAGVKLKLANIIGLKAGYEKSLVFPYVLTWKQGGSYLVDVIAMAMIDNFFDDAVDSSPYAGTICKYVLQGGLLYSMAQLRHEKMAWPFRSAAPLYHDSFTFGVSVSF
jgi:hypothetical protein